MQSDDTNTAEAQANHIASALAYPEPEDTSLMAQLRDALDRIEKLEASVAVHAARLRGW